MNYCSVAMIRIQPTSSIQCQCSFKKSYAKCSSPPDYFSLDKPCYLKIPGSANQTERIFISSS